MQNSESEYMQCLLDSDPIEYIRILSRKLLQVLPNEDLSTLITKQYILRNSVLTALRVFFIVEYTIYIQKENETSINISWTNLPVNSLLQRCDDLLHLQKPFFSYFLSPESILSVAI